MVFRAWLHSFLLITLSWVRARTSLYCSDDRSPEVFKTALEAATQMRAVMGQDPRPNCLVIDEIDGAPAVSFPSSCSLLATLQSVCFVCCPLVLIKLVFYVSVSTVPLGNLMGASCFLDAFRTVWETPKEMSEPSQTLNEHNSGNF